MEIKLESGKQMSLRRHFVTPELLKSESIVLAGAEAHHLLNVIRLRAGERIILQDGLGRGWVSEVIELEKRQLTLLRLEPAELTAEPAIHITVTQAIGKGDKFEDVIQHGTEVGISRFIPVISERTIVRFDQKSAEEKRKRWQAIAINAAEQSHRSIPPEIEAPVKFRELVSSIRGSGLSFLLHPSGVSIKASPIVELLNSALAMILLVGPEGGWSESEIELALEAGLKIVSVGDFVLRTETAALVGAAQILALRV